MKDARYLLLRRRRRGRGLLEAVGPAELLAEAFDSPGRVHELLLAGEERMALRANIDVDFGRRAAGGEGIAAGAVDGAGLVLGMNLGFHDNSIRTVVRLRTSEIVS